MSLITQKRNDSTRIVKFVKALENVGPDIAEISRTLGYYKETVRYWYYKKIIEKGLSLQAIVDRDFLGLKWLVFLLEFQPEIKRIEKTILNVMSKLCYVIGFEKTLLENKYIINANVPVEFVSKYKEFIDQLKHIGLLKNAMCYEFNFFRKVPMKAELYDFDKGIWDFYLNEKDDSSKLSYEPKGRGDFDYIDLLIANELHKDATRNFVEISKQIGVEYKRMMWHYSKHVKNTGMIQGYMLNWMGTKYDYKDDKTLNRKHRYLAIDILASCVDESEAISLSSKINALPFVWCEAVGDSYWAQIAVPAEYSYEVFSFLGKVIQERKDSMRLYLIDQTDVLNFNIPYTLYDEKNYRWIFEQEKIIRVFNEILVKARINSK